MCLNVVLCCCCPETFFVSPENVHRYQNQHRSSPNSFSLFFLFHIYFFYSTKSCIIFMIGFWCWIQFPLEKGENVLCECKKKKRKKGFYVFFVTILAQAISPIVAFEEAKHNYPAQSAWVIEPFEGITSSVCWFRKNKSAFPALQLYVMLHLCISSKGLKHEAVNNCSANKMSNRIPYCVPTWLPSTVMKGEDLYGISIKIHQL